MKYNDVEFSLNEKFIKGFVGKQPQFGPLGYFTYKRTYSRPLENGKSEEFWQTLKRVIEGCFILQKSHCNENHVPWNERKAQKSAQEMFQRMWDFKFLPPGRGLWAMGTDFVFKKGSAALNNCGFVSTTDINTDFSGPFTWLMDMSMHGVGVGFDTMGAAREVALRQPRITSETCIIPDSREGWVDACRRVLDAYVGKDSLPSNWDFSQIRPAGELIQGFGGIAPGPQPLIELIENLTKYFFKYLNTDSPIDSTAIVDIMNFIGAAVVSGGIRRSSEIALGRMDDVEFQDLKTPDENGYIPHCRWASNNSLLASVGSDYSKSAERAGRFGEPGYVWLENARRFGRMKDIPTNRDYRVMGVNPCVPGYTEILTKEGYQRIDSLNKEVSVWNGIEWSKVTPRITGTNQPISTVFLSDGTSLTCTNAHTWVLINGEKAATFELQEGDTLEKFDMPTVEYGEPAVWDYCHGFYCGDGQGTGNNRGALIYDYSKELIPVFESLGCTIGSYQSAYHRTWVGMSHFDMPPKFEVPINLNISSRLNWFAGLLDSDGTVLSNPNSVCIQIANNNKEFLLKVRKMLTTLGVQGKVTLARKERINSMPDGHGGFKEYQCKAQYRLLINATDTAHLISLGLKSYHHSLLKSNPQRDARRFVTVTSIEPMGTEATVYCFSEEKNHTGTFEGIVTGQCGEQSLEPYELCNLVETFPVKHDSMEDYFRTLKFAYLYAKSVTLLPTHDKRTNAVMLRNRRIGTSQSGIVDQINKVGFREHMRWCDEGYQTISKWDTVYSEWLCVSESIKKTTVKPSGTVSLLVGVNPGIHDPHAEYYLRRVRVSKNSTLWKVMEKAGYPVEPDINEPEYTMIVSFPVHEPFFTQRKSDVSMWEQFERASQMQHYWSDNQVSITITVKPEEVKDLAKALTMYETRLKSVSFLPLDGGQYKQAPYEEITKEVYEELASKLKKVKFNLDEEDTGKVVERFCDGDTCIL